MADVAQTFPTNPGFTTVDFSTVSPGITTETNSGKIRRAGFGHSFYTFTVRYPSLTYDQAQTVQGYINRTAGQLNSFEIVLPVISESRATEKSVTTTLLTDYAAGARRVTVTGLTSGDEILRAGDYFKFDNHTKVYQTASTVTANVAGQADIDFGGMLVSSVYTGNVQVVRDSVPFTCIIDNDTVDVSYNAGGITSIALDMREVW